MENKANTIVINKIVLDTKIRVEKTISEVTSDY